MKSSTSSCRANGAINLCHSMTFPVYCGPLFLVCFGVECAPFMCCNVCLCSCFLFLFYFEGVSPCVSYFSVHLPCPCRVLLPLVSPMALYQIVILNAIRRVFPLCSGPSPLLSFVPFFYASFLVFGFETLSCVLLFFGLLLRSACANDISELKIKKVGR